MPQAFLRVAFALAAIGGVACPGSARADNGVTPVIVQNPVTLNPATPNPVTLGNPVDVAKAMGIQHPFEFGARQAFVDNGCAFTATVPAKQRAVIEFVTGTSTLPAGTPLLAASLSTHTDNSLTSPEINPFEDATGEVVVPNFLLIADHLGVDDGLGGRIVTFAQTLRAYADAGTVITVAMSTPRRGTNPDAFCFISLSGQLIDVP
jgi:hypothetical protein